jgi:hypothetical protein
MRGSIAIQDDLLWYAPPLDSPRNEALGRSNIAVFAQDKIDGLSLPIHRAIQVLPSPFAPHICLSAPPRDAYGSGVGVPTFDEFGDVSLHPAQNGRMGAGDACSAILACKSR